VREAARHACWRAGDLRYLLHRGQREALGAILGASARRFVLCTGRRWGKSRLMCVFAALLIVLRIRWRVGVEPPPWVPRDSWLYGVTTRTKLPARVVYAAPTQGMVSEFVEPHMRLLAAHAPPELRPEAVHSDWRWPGGDVLVIKGCEDRKKADRLRGSEADATIADEGGFIPILGYVVRDVLGPQLWETRGHMLLPSTPPESPDHPFVEFLGEAEAASAAYRASTLEAPHLTQEMLSEAIEDAGGADSIGWQREGLARVVVDPERTVLPEFSEHEQIIVREYPRPEHALLHVIGDAGFEDCDVILLGFYDFRADVDVIEAEVVLQHARSDTLDARVAAAEKELWGPRLPKVHRRKVDAQPKVRADMSREEWQAQDPEDAVRHWSSVSRDGGRSAGRMRALANAARVRLVRGRVAIHPRCTTTIAHAKHARWDDHRNDFVRVYDDAHKPVHHYDGCAALLYFLRDLDRSANPYPLLPPGVKDETHFIPVHLRRDPQRDLANIFRRQRGVRR
jgi:hypothetical protein